MLLPLKPILSVGWGLGKIRNEIIFELSALHLLCDGTAPPRG